MAIKLCSPKRLLSLHCRTPIRASGDGALLPVNETPARLVKLRRGGHRDEAGLAEALEAGTIAGCLDVYSMSPGSPIPPAQGERGCPDANSEFHVKQRERLIDVPEQIRDVLLGLRARSASESFPGHPEVMEQLAHLQLERPGLLLFFSPKEKKMVEDVEELEVRLQGAFPPTIPSQPCGWSIKGLLSAPCDRITT